MGVDEEGTLETLSAFRAITDALIVNMTAGYVARPGTAFSLRSAAHTSPPTRSLVFSRWDQPKDTNGLYDVLDALLEEILEAVRERAPDMVVDAARYANAAGVGQPFETRPD